MAWALWLAVPVAGTVVVAIWTWWRARPVRVATSAETIAAHRAYLAALAPPADLLPAGPVSPDPMRSP